MLQRTLARVAHGMVLITLGAGLLALLSWLTASVAYAAPVHPVDHCGSFADCFGSVGAALGAAAGAGVVVAGLIDWLFGDDAPSEGPSSPAPSAPPGSQPNFGPPPPDVGPPGSPSYNQWLEQQMHEWYRQQLYGGFPV